MKVLLPLILALSVNIVQAQNVSDNTWQKDETEKNDQSRWLDNISQMNQQTQTSFIQQIGNQNIAEIHANQISLTQNGQYQQFFYTQSTLLPSNIDVHMEGIDNYTEIMGNNQIMDNAKINIQGDYKSVIIRNYQ